MNYVLYKLFSTRVLYTLFSTRVLYKLFSTRVLYKLFSKSCSIVPRNPASTNSLGALDIHGANILHWLSVNRFWILYRIRHFNKQETKHSVQSSSSSSVRMISVSSVVWIRPALFWVVTLHKVSVERRIHLLHGVCWCLMLLCLIDRQLTETVALVCT